MPEIIFVSHMSVKKSAAPNRGFAENESGGGESYFWTPVNARLLVAKMYTDTGGDYYPETLPTPSLPTTTLY